MPWDVKPLGPPGFAVAPPKPLTCPKFKIQYVDTPWEYANRSLHSKTRFGGGVHSSYGVSGFDELLSWAPQFRAMKHDEPCIMLMWTTGPWEKKAPELIEAYGYEPIKPLFYWVKENHKSGSLFVGGGNYSGANVEILWLAQGHKKRFMPRARGIGLKYPDAAYVLPDDYDPPEIVKSLPHPRNEEKKIIHSAKPSWFADAIVDMWGDEYSRVEVFARDEKPGWWTLGNQAPRPLTITPGGIVCPMPPR